MERHFHGHNLDMSISCKALEALWERLRRLGVVTRQWANSASRTWTTVKRWWNEKKIIICDFVWWRSRANRYEDGENVPTPQKRKVAEYTYPKTNNTHTTLLNALDASASEMTVEVADVEALCLPPPRGSPQSSTTDDTNDYRITNSDDVRPRRVRNEPQ